MFSFFKNQHLSGLIFSFMLGFTPSLVCAFDQIADIPLETIRMPSDDLILPTGERVTPESLWELAESFDLSTLEPFETDLYKPDQADFLNSDNLPIENGEELDFKGVIGSASGTLRFNAYSKNNDVIATIMMDKTLHTILLRKNLLRKLGYVVPAIKYLKKVSIQFESSEELKLFRERSIPEATLGASSRWVVEKESDENRLVLRDVAVMVSKESDHYNLALGVPPKRQTSRQLRSLIIPYSILNVRESVNKLEWNVGRVNNQKIELPHFALADFDATLDDALWMLRRIVKLTRQDFVQIVKDSYYPKEVELILIEKLISRRNSLINLFGLPNAPLNVNSELSSGSALVKGKIVQEEWPEYASRFAYGNAVSPFNDTGLNVLSTLQSSAIDALVSRANNYLQAVDINDSYVDFHQRQFQRGLEHFVSTGEFLEFGVGAWVSPVLNGQLILARDVVVGNYMGTDNLVQLADTFGYAVSLGAHVGIENLPFSYSAFSRATLSYVKTYSHLKPVKTIKDTFKEPYKNMIVPFVKKQIETQLSRFSELSNQLPIEGQVVPDNLKNELSETIKSLNEYLGVGESLIITDRITPQITTSTGAMLGSANMRLSFGADHVTLKRIHLYRKSAELIQIYVDNGYANSLMLTFSMSNYIPVLAISGKRTTGKYNVEAHQMSLNTDLSVNPHLAKKAFALKHLLIEGDGELLNSIENPHRVDSSFLDKSLKHKVFHWRSKTLDANGQLNVKTPEGHESSYISRSKLTQSGINFEVFIKDIANYALGEFFPESGLSLNVDDWRNPGQTFYGIAVTKGSRLEAAYTEDQKGLSHYFIGLLDRREGWRVSKKRLQELLDELNKKYETTLFPKNTLEDTKNLRVYDISVNINIYEKGVERLKTVTIKEIEEIERRYKRERGTSFICSSRSGGLNQMRRNSPECGNLSVLKNLMKRCQKLITFQGNKQTIQQSVECLQEIAEGLREDLEFKDFIKVIGVKNIFLYGAVSGFRGESEILYEPINSNTMGRVGNRYWNGPVEALRDILGLQAGEFNGLWIRESL